MIRVIYNILLVPIFLLALPVFVWKMVRRGGYSQDFAERFCILSEQKRAAVRSVRRIWIHAVSVGEMQIALGFIDAYRRRHSGCRFLISSTTSTGHRMCAGRKHADDILVYVPLDFQFVTDAAMKLYSPELLVLTETEIWPNLIRSAKAAGVKVCIINGRLAEKTMRRYSALGLFFRPVLGMIDSAMMQSERDAERIISVGADPARVTVPGNVKYDIAIRATSSGMAGGSFKKDIGLAGRKVIVGGSTWPGEERALAAVYSRLSADYPDLRLVIVPRHMERRAEVAGILAGFGYKCIRRSENKDAYSGSVTAKDIWLVDTTGELVRFYSAADVVYIGKTLFNRGGQNMIEPAYMGKPIICGPNVQNFPDVAAGLKAAGGLTEVADEAGLEAALRAFLSDPAGAETAGRNARKAIESRSGAMERYVDAVSRLAGKEVAR